MILCNYDKGICHLKGNNYDIMSELMIIMIAMMENPEFGVNIPSLIHDIVDKAAKTHDTIKLENE